MVRPFNICCTPVSFHSETSTGKRDSKSHTDAHVMVFLMRLSCADRSSAIPPPLLCPITANFEN